MSALLALAEENLPILQVLLPLLAAPACVVVRHKRASYWLTLGVTWITLGLSLRLATTALEQGVLSYAVGGWEPPWGIEIRIEPLNAFVLVLVSLISAVVLLAAPRSFDRQIAQDRHHLAYAAFLLCMTGLLGITSAGDAFNIFVFLEISSLASYALVAMGPTRRALSAAFRYLILGTIGGTFVLLGVGLLYMSTGTLNLVDLYQRIPEADADRTLMVALVCIVVGASLKLALFPLHGWLPDAYTFAPAVVTAFLAATATKVAYYVLARFLYRVFGPEFAFERFHIDDVLLPLSLVAMVGGALLAIWEEDVKRLLAFSSLSQIGYMVLGLSLVSVNGLTGGIVHLMNHALMKSGLFLVTACLAFRLGSTRLRDLRGFGRTMPFTGAAFVLGGLALVGVPSTVGFVSKWYLVLGAVEAGRWVVVAAILGSSLLALVYVWKVVEVAYFEAPPEDAAEKRDAPFWLLGPAWLLVAATVIFGLWTEPTVGLARVAAESLLADHAGVAASAGALP